MAPKTNGNLQLSGGFVTLVTLRVAGRNSRGSVVAGDGRYAVGVAHCEWASDGHPAGRWGRLLAPSAASVTQL